MILQLQDCIDIFKVINGVKYDNSFIFDHPMVMTAKGMMNWTLKKIVNIMVVNSQWWEIL